MHSDYKKMCKLNKFIYAPIKFRKGACFFSKFYRLKKGASLRFFFCTQACVNTLLIHVLWLAKLISKKTGAEKDDKNFKAFFLHDKHACITY